MDVFWGQLQILKQALAEGRMTYTDTATLELILVSIWFSVTQHPSKSRITQGEEE